MGKRKYACDVYSAGESDYYSTEGHHPDADFLASLEDCCGKRCKPEDIERNYYRFIPIRGEPNEDTWALSGYSFDELRNGYWFRSTKGPGAVPVTEVDRARCTEAPEPKPVPFAERA
jgi:hypothetical protein